MVFGTKKLRGAGGDLGSAIKNFKKAIKGSDDQVAEKIDDGATVIEGEVTKDQDKV